MKPGAVQLPKSFWVCWGDKGECQVSSRALEGGDPPCCSRLMVWVDVKRPVGCQAFSGSLWLQALPPTPSHNPECAFENVRTPLHKVTSWVGAHWWLPLVPESSAVPLSSAGLACHSLSLDSQHSTSPGGPSSSAHPSLSIPSGLGTLCSFCLECPSPPFLPDE